MSGACFATDKMKFDPSIKLRPSNHVNPFHAFVFHNLGSFKCEAAFFEFGDRLYSYQEVMGQSMPRIEPERFFHIAPLDSGATWFVASIWTRYARPVCPSTIDTRPPSWRK